MGAHIFGVGTALFEMLKCDWMNISGPNSSTHVIFDSILISSVYHIRSLISNKLTISRSINHGCATGLLWFSDDQTTSFASFTASNGQSNSWWLVSRAYGI
jgi:hypothetical protein